MFRRKLEAGTPVSQVVAAYIDVCNQDQICDDPEIIKMWSPRSFQIRKTWGNQNVEVPGLSKCESPRANKMWRPRGIQSIEAPGQSKCEDPGAKKKNVEAPR
jgi:hypothetical protein